MNTVQGFKRLLYLFLLYAVAGFLFDFSSTLYAWFIPTPLIYPTIGDMSLLLWGLITSYLFLSILKTLNYQNFSPIVFLLLFSLIFGIGIQFASNSIQIKLWHLGYNDTLGLGLPSHASLEAVSNKLREIFQYLYFSDEVIAHFFIFISLLSFFLLFYKASYTATSIVQDKKNSGLFFIVVIFNALYMAWNMVEGQSVPLFLFACLLMVGIKIYYHYQRLSAGPLSKTLEWIFVLTLFFIGLWIGTVGHFKTIPQFFETLKTLL